MSFYNYFKALQEEVVQMAHKEDCERSRFGFMMYAKGLQAVLDTLTVDQAEQEIGL